MIKPLSRRAFAKLASWLIADGVTADLSALSPTLRLNAQVGTKEQPQFTVQETQSGVGTTKNSTSQVLASISDYASKITEALSNAANNLAHASFTASTYNFASLQGGNAGGEVEYGTAWTFTPSTTDYALENFRTEITSTTTALGVEASFGAGFSFGLGTGFNGQSANSALSVGPVTVAYTSSQSYSGVSVSIGSGVGVGASQSNESNTTPIGAVEEGNAARNLEGLQNALMESSTDYLRNY